MDGRALCGGRSLVRLVLDIPWGNAQLENSTLPVSSLPSIATETRPPVAVNLRRNLVLDEKRGGTFPDPETCHPMLNRAPELRN